MSEQQCSLCSTTIFVRVLRSDFYVMAQHPPRLTLAGLFLGFLLIVSPSKANQCKSGCHGIHTSNAYQEGYTYTYQLEGTSVTSVSDAQGEATLKLNANVELAIKPNCIHQIRLQNVQINGAPASQGEIEAHALQFNYHNGHIDTEVCAESGDSQAALNVKRAVISLFQDAIVQDDGATTHHETDVFGACPTDFTFTTNGETRTIRKQRDLDQCSYREHMKQDLIFSTFNQNSNVKSTPVLAAEQKVEQQFNRGILHKATSVETYKFKPFSTGEAGAKTVVETKLTLKGERGGSQAAPVSEPKSLIFEAPHQVVRSSIDAIERAFHVVKESMPDAVTRFSARRFAEFIKVLRQSSKNDILAVFSRIRPGTGHHQDGGKSVFLDGLFRAGTGDSVEAAIELIKNRRFTEIETIVFYTSLAFVRHASLSSVTAVVGLLDDAQLPRIAYLGIGSLIGKYCLEHKCENVPEVQAALQRFSSKLTTSATSRDQENIIIASLKGLGNTRYLDDATLTKIAGIATDKRIHNRIRIAALEALPTRCSMTWKDIVFSTFADRTEDSEIRIKTYLSLVACPCSHVANKVKEVLDKETVNQVGSFITSHLRNLRASTNPDKAEAKHQLGLVKPRIKFPENFYKFSYNNEFSYNIDAFGVGSSVENNVIFSQNSFLPRSVNLNFTAEVFGRTFNFLEIDSRFENLDKWLERYLGPKGLFRPSNIKDVVLDGRKAYDELIEKIAKRFNRKVGRQGRDVSQREIENFGRSLKLPETELDDEVQLDLSIKLFGAELIFLTHHCNEGKIASDRIINQILDFIESGVDKVKQFDYHLKNHLQFLDAELIYPTGLGLPLAVGVTGTSAVHLKTSGKIDLVAIFKNPKSSAIQVALEPSASIRIAGSLIIEGFGVESGLKVITTLHTATGTDISLKLLGGNGIDISVGLPRQKQELISISSEVLVSSGAKGDDYVAPKFPKGKQQNNCFNQLAGIIGLTLCAELSYPYDNVAAVQKRAPLPFSGPASVAVYLENNDVRSYHFKAYYDNSDPNRRSLEILLETPNSRTNRKISLLAELSVGANKFVKVTFDSPFKKASAEAVLKTTAQEQTITVTFNHDTITYFIRTGLISSGNRYRPILEYKVPEHIEKLAGVKNGVKNTQRSGQAYNVGGVIDVSNQNGEKKYVFNRVVLTSDGQIIIGIDGDLAITRTGGQADLKIDYGGDNLQLNGNVAISNRYNHKTEISLLPSRKPELGFSISYEIKGDQNSLTELLVIIHGNDLRSTTNRFTYSGEHNVRYVSIQDFDISLKRKVTYPVLGLVVHVEGGVTPKSVEYDIELKYGQFKLESELDAKTGTKKPGDYDIEFEAKLQANSIKFKTSRDILGEHKNKFETSLELQPGGKYEIETIIDHVSKPSDVNTQVNAVLKYNENKIIIDAGLELAPSKTNSHAVITYENAKYLDFLLALQLGANQNGNLKINLKNHLIVNGQFRYQKESGGNAHIEINIPKFNRKITGDGSLSVTGSKHVTSIEILYDATKDPKKRIKFYSDSDFKATSFDSKNTLDVLNSKTEFNAKGEYSGQFDNGHSNLEFDITLPDGRYFVGKGTRDVTTRNELMDGKIDVELIDHITKGGKNRKLILHAEVHELNIQKSTYKSQQVLQLINFDGQDIKLSTALKHLPIGTDKISTEGKLEVTGSKMPTPFSFEISHEAENEGQYGTGKLRTSLGDNFSLQFDGKFNLGNHVDVPASTEAVVEVKLPSDKLRNIKLELSGTGLVPKETGSRSEFNYKGKLTYNNDKTIKIDSHFTGIGVLDKEHIVEGSGKVTVTVLNNAPVTVSGNYKYNPLNKLKQSSGGLSVNYGNKQTSITYDGSHDETLNDINFNIKIETPNERIRNFDLKLKHKCTGTPGFRCLPSSDKMDYTLVSNKVQYTGNTEIEISETAFSSHLIHNSPEGKFESTIKVNKLREKEITTEWKLNHPKGFLNFDAHLNLVNLDDFRIVANFDTDKLETRKIHTEIVNRPAKGGKKIMINISSNGQNIISGSTNYKKHTEGGKVIVEGNGSLRIRERTKSSSFKYTRQDLTADIDGETGVATLLNFNFGPSSVVGEFKATNKEFYLFDSYCEQSADCAQIKLQSKIHQTGLKRTQEITFEVDLRKFKVPYEFGFKSTQAIDPETGFDETTSLYLHSANGKTEYSYQIYAHPTGSGIIITLPSRELALIGTVEFPKNKRFGGYKIDISFYLDRKRDPRDKTSLTMTGDVDFERDFGTITGETRFTYPSQTKDLSIKGKVHFGGAHLFDGNLDIDVFARKNQKIAIVAKATKTPIDDNNGYNITSVVSIYSQGQRLKVDINEYLAISRNEIGYGSVLSYTDEHQQPKSTGIQFSANLREAHLSIFSPDKQLIKADSQFEVAKNVRKAEFEVSLFDTEPFVVIWELKDFNSFKYLAYQKKNPNNKLEAVGHVVLGEVAEIHAETVRDGTKNELFHLNLRLDGRNYLKPDLVVNKQNIGAFVEFYRAHLIQITKAANEVVEGVIKEIITEFKDLFEHLQKAKPNLKPLLDHYISELNKLKQELNVETEGIRDLQAKLNEIFGGTITTITEIIKILSDRSEEFGRILSEILNKINVAIKSVQPEFQKVWRAVNALAVELINEAVTIVDTLLKKIVDIINANKEEFQQIAVISAEIAQDIAKIIIRTSTKIQSEIKEFYTVFITELKALPIYKTIQEKYAEILNYQISDGIIRAVTDLVQSFKQTLPTTELQNLVTALYDYIIKHVKREEVDDVQEIKKLYSSALQAIKSVINLLKSQPTTGNFIEILEAQIPIDFSGFAKLPGISTLKVSLVSLFRNKELPSPSDLFFTYRPTVHPTNTSPHFSKFALFGEGTHFLTFDRRRLTIPGTCSYVLAQDALDGNFSIIAETNNGHLTSVTITDPTESITLEANGKILVNNQPADFPADTKNLHASLREPTVIVVSEYGVKLSCNKDSRLVCSLDVSGFYHGRLRGLLGNANNEPWDDYILPSGKVVEKETEFGNAYKLKPGCPDVQAVNYDAQIPHDSLCTEFFTGRSYLSPCFNFVDPNFMRSTCDWAAQRLSATEKKEVLCKQAQAYALTCLNAGINVPVPTTCVACHVGNKKINFGDSFSVAHPKQQADVVFVVEQASKNAEIFTELVIPLINVIKSELKEHGITDVHVGLIGYGEEIERPQHFTYKGSRNIGGEVKNMKFTDTKPAITFEEARAGDVKKRLEYLKEQVINELGLFKLTEAYEEALAYDFRPGASKTVIGVFATPCQKSPLPISFQQLRLLLGQIAYSDLGLTYHQIAHLDDIVISGKVAKNVVGYDADGVFTFADSKKKPVEGNAKLKNEMVVATSDVCADFAADAGGAAFSASNFLNAKANQKKQFTQVVARRIVNSLVNIEVKEDCVCRQSRGMFPKAECEIVSRKEKESRTKSTKNRKG